MLKPDAGAECRRMSHRDLLTHLIRGHINGDDGRYLPHERSRAKSLHLGVQMKNVIAGTLQLSRCKLSAHVAVGPFNACPAEVEITVLCREYRGPQGGEPCDETRRNRALFLCPECVIV
jgi:hypothetical protein